MTADIDSMGRGSNRSTLEAGEYFMLGEVGASTYPTLLDDAVTSGGKDYHGDKPRGSPGASRKSSERNWLRTHLRKSLTIGWL